MTVLLRPALATGIEPLLGAFATVAVAAVVALVATTIQGDWEVSGLGPYILAGVLGPGISQVLFTYAVREAGPSRTSATVGIAPLFAVVFAVRSSTSRSSSASRLGALAIVAGGVLLATESGRPDHVRPIGLLLALGAALVFATRDTFVRRSRSTQRLARARDHRNPRERRADDPRGAAHHPNSCPCRSVSLLPPAGIAFGISYISLYEAFYRGKLSVVAPLVRPSASGG